MQLKYALTGTFVLVIFVIVFISGCAQTPESTSPATSMSSTTQVCGNNVVDSGEECDGDGCPAGKVCTENCKCEVPSPPALPE